MSPKKQASPIKIGTHTLKEEDQATYIGVTFDIDKRQSCAN